MPENIRKGRNIAIILGFVEIVCCLLSFGFYDVDRARIVLVLCVLNCVATAGGFYAKLKLSYWGLLAHATYTISIIGGFYIYIIIDICLRTDKAKKGSMSDTWVLMITSIPLVGLFIMGIYSCILVLMVDEELDQRKKVLQEQNGGQQNNKRPGANGVEFRRIPVEELSSNVDNARSGAAGTDVEGGRDSVYSVTAQSLANQEHIVEILEIKPDQVEAEECVICLTKNRDSIFYPCGHQCLCFDCGERFKKEARHQVCPLCRNRVKDIIRVYK